MTKITHTQLCLSLLWNTLLNCKIPHLLCWDRLIKDKHIRERTTAYSGKGKKKRKKRIVCALKRSQKYWVSFVSVSERPRFSAAALNGPRVSVWSRKQCSCLNWKIDHVWPQLSGQRVLRSKPVLNREEIQIAKGGMSHVLYTAPLISFPRTIGKQFSNHMQIWGDTNLPEI